jgi:hypothetical protein
MRNFIYVTMALLCLGLITVETKARSPHSSSGDGIQIEFQFHGKGFGEGNGSCTLDPGTSCQGMAWTGEASGFSLGSITRTIPVRGADFELIFSFSCATEDGRPFLDGVLYSLDITSGRKIVTGQRKEIHEPIEFGEPHTLLFASERTDKSIEMEYTLEGGSVESEIVFGSSTLALKSFDRGGRSTSSTGEVHGLIREDGDRDNSDGNSSGPQHFSFSFAPDGRQRARRDTAVNYDVTISFDPPLERDQFPMRSIMKLDRMYWIDTLHVPGEKVSPNWGTGFSYSKSVEVVPGKVLKLVFPPEPKLRLPFQIEDTVVITP